MFENIIFTPKQNNMNKGYSYSYISLEIITFRKKYLPVKFERLSIQIID